MRLRPALALPAIALLTGAALASATASPAAADTGGARTSSLSVSYSFADGLAASISHPGANPPGANDWSCRPSAAHPRPVVLVHGTFGNMTDSWNALSPLLKNSGYCVYAFNYGGMFLNQIAGYEDIPTSAGQLASFVDRVLSSTGAAKVDVVGHSQGGMMPRYYLKNLGGGAKVGSLVGLSPSSHGTTLNGLTALLDYFPWADDAAGLVCKACQQQVRGSDFMTALNSGGDTVAGVKYTVIETVYDEVVTPYSSEFLSGPNVTNILLQDSCWVDYAEHLAVIYDHIALRYVLNALDPAHAQSPVCYYVAPGNGG